MRPLTLSTEPLHMRQAFRGLPLHLGCHAVLDGRASCHQQQRQRGSQANSDDNGGGGDDQSRVLHAVWRGRHLVSDLLRSRAPERGRSGLLLDSGLNPAQARSRPSLLTLLAREKATGAAALSLIGPAKTWRRSALSGSRACPHSRIASRVAFCFLDRIGLGLVRPVRVPELYQRA
jgi:hypothetical protein